MEPIFFRGSIRAASRLPEFIREGSGFGMSEGGEAVITGRRLSLKIWRVLEGLPRAFMSSQVILLTLLLGNTMSVRVIHSFHRYRFATTETASALSAVASPDEEISCAPVCFRRSFARPISSEVSQ
jgi:hypothetical protein